MFFLLERLYDIVMWHSMQFRQLFFRRSIVTVSLWEWAQFWTHQVRRMFWGSWRSIACQSNNICSNSGLPRTCPCSDCMAILRRQRHYPRHLFVISCLAKVIFKVLKLGKSNRYVRVTLFLFSISWSIISSEFSSIVASRPRTITLFLEFNSRGWTALQ